MNKPPDPSEPPEPALAQVLSQTRTLYRRLFRIVEERMAQHGLNAGQRGVLEFVVRGGGQTVPQIAQRHDVSRQHIQMIVNDLQGKGLVQAVENPAHRRSVLIGPTARGRRLFATIEATELRAIWRMNEALSERDLRTTAETLRAIEAMLATANPEEPKK